MLQEDSKITKDSHRYPVNAPIVTRAYEKSLWTPDLDHSILARLHVRPETSGIDAGENTALQCAPGLIHVLSSGTHANLASTVPACLELVVANRLDLQGEHRPLAKVAKSIDFR